MKVVQINTKINSGSTGRIAETIGKTLINRGHTCFVGYGRGDNPSSLIKLPIGNKISTFSHGIQTLLFDKHGLGSMSATRKFLSVLDGIKPDLIQLHNLHGYYFNYPLFFDFIRKRKIPIVWTLHDCWSFTGHCTYFDNISCTKWINGCFSCPKTNMYPKSLLIDRSKLNYQEKRNAYEKINDLYIITPSFWLGSLVKNSFLKYHKLMVIHNGIDTQIFKPYPNNDHILDFPELRNKKILLGVANVWDKRKGLEDFKLLSKKLSHDYKLVLIGIDKATKDTMPKEIVCVERTESIELLAKFYSSAFLFINPTWQDNFPTTNLESLACGTPVITYNTGGSPEAIDSYTGSIVEKGDIDGLIKAILKYESMNMKIVSQKCRERVLENFDKELVMNRYVDLYEEIISMKS